MRPISDEDAPTPARHFEGFRIIRERDGAVLGQMAWPTDTPPAWMPRPHQDAWRTERISFEA